MSTANIRQMGAFLFIGEMGANAIGHRPNNGAVDHVQPIRPANEFPLLISSKWIVWICPQIRLIKNYQYFAPLLADDHVLVGTMVASLMILIETFF